MVNEKILNTRIITKHADWTTWKNSNLALKEGEIVLAKVLTTETDTTGRIKEVPAYIAKVGTDGKTFNESPWMYAKAVDVYGWAKKEHLDVADMPILDFGGEEEAANIVESIKNFVAAEIKAITDKLGELPTGDNAPETFRDFIDTKVDKVEGKGLSTNDLTNDLKTNYDEAYAHSLVPHAPAAAQENVIEKIKVNGAEQTITADKAVDITVPAAPEYTVVKAEDSGDYAAVYNLTKNGEIVGASINIPKDLVVKSGSVVDDEIVLVLNNEDATEIKIPVGSLIEYVTSGSNEKDMVVITVDETTHKVTAAITDGTVTLAKLDVETQTKINKAHEHSNKALLDTYTQTETDLADAVAKKHAHSIVAANATAVNTFVDTVAQDEHGQITVTTKAVDFSGVTNEVDKKVETIVGTEGIEATREGNTVTIGFDDTYTFIFDCGGAE